MQSRNPVFARSDNFDGKALSSVQSDPSPWQIDLNGESAPQALTGERRMTLDSVVEKTGLTLGLLVVAAAVTWFAIGDPLTGDDALANAIMFAGGGAIIIGLGLSLGNSFKKVVSPAFVLAFAVVEGVFVGALSKLLATTFGSVDIVFQAVLGTMVAFGGTLFAYRFFNIRVTDKFRKVMTIAMFSFVGVMLVNLVLSLTGVLDNGGLRGFNALGLLVSAVAVLFAVFMLIMDFDYVERGVAAGLPERESWRAAFGLTVTLVWLYIEILRILEIRRRN